MQSKADPSQPIRDVGFVWHERYAWHDTGNWAGMLPSGGLVEPYKTFESPETKRRFAGLLEVAGVRRWLVEVAPRAARQEELLRCHSISYLDRLEELSARGGGDAGEAAPLGAESWEIVLLAAGGAIEATRAVLDRKVEVAYALVRPPGHHAERDAARGFCFVNNVAVAVHHAMAEHGLERIAIVDWDVHHGNGIEQAFIADPRVLTISIHQDRLYPVETGATSSRGVGDGFGSNLNLALPPGCGHGAYMAAVDEVVLPALEVFGPELIVVACGFDACLFDPLGHMLLSAQSYRAMTERILLAAGQLCGGKLVMIHEGGYSPEYVPFCGLATIDALLGTTTEFLDYVDLWVQAMPGFVATPHQIELVQSLTRLIPEIPR